MYIFKDKNVAKIFNKKVMAEKIGIHPDTLRKIVNGKLNCSRIMAYCITKFINSEKEIEDYFKLEN